jgi:hypothetical protein
MVATTVYGCDWCDEIVPKRDGGSRDGEPKFAARITVTVFGVVPMPPQDSDICKNCLKALQAVMKGQYRR